MNELLTTYFKVSLTHRCCKSGSKTESLSGDQLDNIWYNQMDNGHRNMVHLLLVDHNSRTAGVEQALNRIIAKLQEKPAMANVFETKEDYLKLRDFWSQLIKDGKHKPVKQEYYGGFHMQSPLVFNYHLIYLAATGKCLSKATKGMWLETITTTLHTIHWARKDKAVAKKYFFDFFGDAIAEEHYDAILNRLEEYFTIEKKTFGK